MLVVEDCEPVVLSEEQLHSLQNPQGLAQQDRVSVRVGVGGSRVGGSNWVSGGMVIVVVIVWWWIGDGGGLVGGRVGG